MPPLTLKQGYLDLEHPKQDTFKPMIWRLQLFDVGETEDEVTAIEARKRHASFTELLNNVEEWQGESPRHISHDSNETFDVDEFPKDDDPIVDGDYTNPMRFPVWPDHKEPSYPGRPLLRLSAGYGRATVRCC